MPAGHQQQRVRVQLGQREYTRRTGGAQAAPATSPEPAINYPSEDINPEDIPF